MLTLPVKRTFGSWHHLPDSAGFEQQAGGCDQACPVVRHPRASLGRAPTTPPIRSRRRQARFLLYPQNTWNKNAKKLAAPTSLSCPELLGACGNPPGLVVGASNRIAFAQVENHGLAVTAPSCGMLAMLSCIAAACSAAGKPVAVAAPVFELVWSAWRCCWVKAPAAEGAEHGLGGNPR